MPEIYLRTLPEVPSSEERSILMQDEITDAKGEILWQMIAPRTVDIDDGHAVVHKEPWSYVATGLYLTLWVSESDRKVDVVFTNSTSFRCVMLDLHERKDWHISFTTENAKIHAHFHFAIHFVMLPNGQSL